MQAPSLCTRGKAKLIMAGMAEQNFTNGHQEAEDKRETVERLKD